jgi:pimeloyl-ACP methyl ester carboxylesterase
VDSASLALPAGGIGAARVSPQFTQNFAPGTLRTEHLAPTPQDMRRYMGSMTYDHSMLCDPLIDRMVVLAKKWLPIWEAPFAQFWADGGVRNRAQYEVDGVHLTTHLESLGKQPLIVWGKNSGKGLDNGLDFYRRIPDAQFHVFDKADHFLWLDRWKDFNGLVTWFLSRT